MSDEGRAELPPGIEEMPAGAALAAALDGVDAAAVSPFDSVRLVRARRRQLSHDQSQFAEAVLECALAEPHAAGGRTETVSKYGADELREVLHESDWAVGKILDRAEFARRWPTVESVWREGTVDVERVRVLESWTAALSEEHCAQVLEVVVPEAGTLTLSGLIDRIEQVARDLDPEWARKRYEAHKAQRRVRARRTEAGTVNLSGLDLGLDDGALAQRHIAVLAGRAQAMGHPGLLETIEADIYVALLKPRAAGWSDDDLVASVLAAADPTDPADPRPAPDPDLAPADGPVPGDVPDENLDGGLEGPADESDDDQTEDEDEDAGGADATTDVTTDDPTTDDATTDDASEADAGEATDAPPTGAESPAGGRQRLGVRRTRRTRLVLRVGLLTLLGLDRNTARLPGYGVVHAELARKLCRDWADAEWRLALQDESGALSTVLVSTRRPDGWATVPINPDGTPTHPGTYHPAVGHPDGSPAPPRPMVVIHATEEQLDRLDTIALIDPETEHPGWADWLADLRRQHTFWRRDATRRAAQDDPGLDLGVRLAGGPVDLGRQLRDHLDRRTGDRTTGQAGGQLTDQLGALLADLGADPDARFPTAAQRRWITERNQTCTYPPCRADAAHADVDHTDPARAGGPTLTWNLGPACPHDNRLKEQPGWWVEQPEPGHFVWHSNTGHTYPSTPTGPVPDHPPPVDLARSSRVEPLEYAGNHGTWTNHPYPGAAPSRGNRERPPPDRSPDRSPGRPAPPPAPDADPPPF